MTRLSTPLLALAPLFTLAACEASLGADGNADADLSQPDASDSPPADAEPPAACPRARVSVAAGARLNVRPQPSTEGAPVASLPNHAVVTVLEEVQGQAIDGDTRWLHIDSALGAGYISSVFAECTSDEAPVLTPPDAFRLPLECETSATISQGNNGGFSHKGKAAYAFDFSLGIGVPLVAMADGIVTYTFAETGPGDPCYNGGGPDCFPYANYVVLEHGDGTSSIYKHLTQVLVTEGEFVPSGVPIGLSGSTGYSTGPHAHVMRMETCGAATSCQSIAVSFADVAGNGVPTQGQTVTSGNCP